MPLPTILAFLVSWIALLLLTKLRRLALGLLVTGTALLLLVSIPPLSERALLDLERSYPMRRLKCQNLF